MAHFHIPAGYKTLVVAHWATYVALFPFDFSYIYLIYYSKSVECGKMIKNIRIIGFLALHTFFHTFPHFKKSVYTIWFITKLIISNIP